MIKAIQNSRSAQSSTTQGAATQSVITPPHKLTGPHISLSSLPADKMEEIFNGLKGRSDIQSLTINKSVMTSQNIKILCESLKTCTGLVRLTFEGAGINDEGAKTISELLMQPTLSLAFLNLKNNRITSEGIGHLAIALRQNKKLINLNLESNPIPGEALATLGDALCANKTLTTLSLQDTQIKPDHAEAFIARINPKGGKKKDPRNIRLTSLIISNQRASVYQPIVPKKPAKTTSIIENYQKLAVAKAGDLCSAVISGEEERVNNLIKDTSMYVTGDNDNTLLHLAIIFKHVSIVRHLLQLSFNKNLRNKDGLTALELAQQKQAVATDLEEKRKYEEIARLLTVIPAQATSSASTTAVSSKKRKLEEKRTVQNDDDATEELPQTTAAATTSATNAAIAMTAPTAKEPKLETFDDDASTTDHGYATTNDYRATSSTTTISTSRDDSLRVFDLVSSGHLYQLRSLLRANPGLLLLKDGDDNTLLHIAVNANQLQCVEFLLQTKIKLNTKNNIDRPAFYQLIFNLSAFSANDIALQTAMDIAWLLIRRGARVDLVVNDPKLSRTNLTALHLAAAYGYYRLLKIILAAPECDLNAKDSGGWTALDWAVSRGDERMIRRLLIEPRLTKESIDLALVKARTLSLETIKNLLEQASNQRRLTDDIGIQWVKNFFVSYGSSQPQRALAINSDAHHAELLLQNSFSKQRLFNPETDNDGELKDTDGNPVTASLTFVVSAKPYQRNEHPERITITVPLNFTEEFHIAEGENDYHENIIHRAESAPPKIFDKYNTHVPKTADEIHQKHEAREENPSFWNDFHHGEQTLLNYLEDPKTAQMIAQKLITQPNFKAGCKVYAVILNIHSPRYVCHDCEVGILGEQNSQQSRFLSNLGQALQNINCILPRYSPLRMLTQVSSYMAFQSEKNESADHTDASIDLRACHNRLILERDVEETTADATQFQSSKPK